MAARKFPMWLAALIVLVPAAVTAVVITVRGAGPDSAEEGTPASLADYEIRAPIRPVRTAAIDQAISSPAELPAPNDCEHLLTWASGKGTAAVNIGRIDLRLTANRLLQVTVNEVTVAVTKVQPTTAKTLIQGDTSDWRNRWEPLPTDRQFSESLAVHRKDYFTEVPVVTLDDNKAPVVTDQRRWAKDRAFDPQRAAPKPRGGSYLCEALTDAEPAAVLGNRIEAFVTSSGTCAWMGAQKKRIELYLTRHPDDEVAKEQYQHNVDARASDSGVAGTSLPNLGDEATLLGGGHLIARRGRDTLFITGDKGAATMLEGLARAAAARLWINP